ncbi:MAG: cation:proton antiporter [Nitrosomonadaceae bacterium]
MVLESTDMHTILIALGGMFLLGLMADLIGRRTSLPRVSLLLLTGLLIGPSGFSLLPEVFIKDWFPLLTHIALSMVGFLLGQKLSLAAMRRHGRSILWITAGKVIGATMLVALCLYALGVELAVILLLASIASATAPAVLLDVVKEMRVKGKFADIMLGIVALDDAWALLIFSFMLAAVGAVSGQGGFTETITSGFVEISGSLLLGLALGLPMAYLSGRIRPGEPTLAEALGLVALCAGIAVWLDLSPILAAMMMGSTVASLASHHERAFNEIDGIEWPFMILFFLLAGASLNINELLAVSWVGVVYILARTVGTYCGAGIAARFSGAEAIIQRWMGVCLLPQAGVAIGMALMVSQRFPELKNTILPIVICSTVFFEIIGPVVTRRVLKHVKSVEPTLINM